MPIYTKTGDKGKTGLVSGQRVSKSSPVINFIGSLDELNALLGICIAELIEVEESEEADFEAEIGVLEDIQKDLFIVGAVAAGASLKFEAHKEVSNIEKTIDDYEKLLPKLKNFILPGGTMAAAHIHNARVVSRKMEREAVALKSPSIEPFLSYLNRLSDLLFVMARFVNKELNEKETIWTSR